ncbi:MAG: hypothetical protein KA712_04245 [Myxococcales bacterium]|nr:hypothetical protein [Myxococcales bacterium]
MKKRPRARGPAAALACLVAGLSTPVRAQPAPLVVPPTTHPIYVSAEGAALDDQALASFRQATAKLGLPPVETVDLPALPKPSAPGAVIAGVAQVRDLAFEQGAKLLETARAEVAETGAEGLSHDELCDLFLYLGMALDQADWHDLPEEGPPAPSPTAGQAYLQAAALCPERELYHRTYPPLALHRFQTAVAEVRTRGQGTLVVRAPADALVSVDALPAQPAPVTLALPFGEHFIRVERPGRHPWATRVPLALPRLEVEAPAQAFRTFPDLEAAAHARRMGAAYALVAELKPGPDPLLEARLVEVASGRRIDSTRVPLTGEPGGVHAAVMRLDEQARRRDMLAQTGDDIEARGPTLAVGSALPKARDPQTPGPHEDFDAWARARWPLLAAVGVVVATSLVLGLAVALDD